MKKAGKMEREGHLELTFLGRTYMILLYVISTIFILLILGGVLNSVSPRPNPAYDLYLALGLWICFIAGGMVYEYHREVFLQLGMKRRSVRILMPLIFLLIIGIPIILVSEYVTFPEIRLVFSVIVVLLGVLMWRLGSMLIRERRKAYLEREF